MSVTTMDGKTYVAQMNEEFLEHSEQRNLQSSKDDPNPSPKTAGSANSGNRIILNLQIFEPKGCDLVKQELPRDGRQSGYRTHQHVANKVYQI